MNPLSRPWGPLEIATLREYYPSGGAKAVMRQLREPRSQTAVRKKAQKLKLRYNRRRQIVFHEAIDAAISEAYRDPNRPKGFTFKLAQRFGISPSSLRRRASFLGVTAPHRKTPFWCEEEIDLLDKTVHLTPYRASEAFLKHGFHRTPSAIASRRAVMAFRVENSEVLSASRLAEVMGVSTPVVVGWIKRGMLRATPKGTQRPAEKGDIWHIHPNDVRRLIIDYTAHISLAKCDKYWLVDLLAVPERPKYHTTHRAAPLIAHDPLEGLRVAMAARRARQERLP